MPRKYTSFHNTITNSKIIFDQDKIWNSIENQSNFSEKTTAFCEGKNCPYYSINKGNHNRPSNVGRCKLNGREVVLNQSVCPLGKER